MDAIHSPSDSSSDTSSDSSSDSSSYYASDQMHVLKSRGCESTNYTNESHIVEAFEFLQSLREYVMKIKCCRINIHYKCLF